MVIWVELLTALIISSCMLQSHNPHMRCIFSSHFVGDLMLHYIAYLSFAGSLPGFVPQWDSLIHSAQYSDIQIIGCILSCMHWLKLGTVSENYFCMQCSHTIWHGVTDFKILDFWVAVGKAPNLNYLFIYYSYILSGI